MMYNRFKDRSPKDTVEVAKKVLNFFNLDIKETVSLNPLDSVYSCRVEVPSLNFGANGKGTTKEYTYASAYGELIERLFNHYYRYSYISQFHPINKFYDGVKFSIDNQLLSLPSAIITDMESSFFEADKRYPSKNELIEVYKTLCGSDTIESVPFYDVSGKDSVYLPECIISSLALSSGLSCGNTLEEAISQATFEILERYVHNKIVVERLTPPEIPHTYIQNVCPELTHIIELLSSSGLTITVYDCSLDAKFPVIAVLLVHKETCRYKLNFGSHFSFRVALERCLTEILQGYPTTESLYKFGMTELSYETDKGLDRFSTYYKRFSNNIGPLPYEFFKLTPSYTFKGWQYDCEGWSNTQIVQELMTFCLSISPTVYIRNNSCMGLSVVRVYIPKISHMPYTNPIGLSTAYTKNQQYCLEGYDFDNIKIHQDELLDFKRVIENSCGQFNKNTGMDNNILLSAVLYDLGEIEQCIDVLRDIEHKPPYIKVILQIFDLLGSGISNDEVYGILQHFYDTDCIELAIFLLRGDFLNKCITCLKRDNAESAEYYKAVERNIVAFILAVCSYMKKHPINQNATGSLFQ